MPEENQEGSAYGDISSKESVDGLVVPTTNPFYPNIEFRYSDDGDFEGYKVDFNQGYIFNRVSATQVDDIGDTGICTISQMAQSFELDKEHDKKFYVEASISASNFLIESAIFTGFDADGDQPSTEFPEIIFADEVEKASYTGYFPVLQLKNGSLLKYTQRNNIFLSDRQFKQLGAEGSAAGIENRAQVLVKDGKGSEFNPVRVRAVRGIGGVEVFQEPSYIVISGSTGTEFSGQNIGGGRKVYVDGTTDPAQFRTLTGAENIEISIVGDTVEIKSEDINCTSAHWNAYVDGTTNPAKFRGLNAGDGVTFTPSADAEACVTTISVDTGCCDLENTTNAGSFTTNNITINSSVDVGTAPLNVVTNTTNHEAITVWCGGQIVQEYKTDSSCNAIVEINDSSATTVNKLTASSFGNYFNTHTAIGTSSPDSSYSLYVNGNVKIQDSSNANNGKLQFGNNTDNTIEIDQSNGEFKLGAGVTKIESAQSDTMHVFSETSASYSAIGCSLVYNSPATGSAILGGSGNYISGNFDVIVAGVNNSVSGGFYNFIGGGTGIDITGSSYSSSIGGLNNDIFGSDYAIIGGGDSNKIEHSDRAFIGGGTANHIVGANFSTIGGGQNNIIKDKSSLIGGGESNEIRFQAANGGYNFIGAGVSNIISGGQSSIAGGNNNVISGSRSVTLGGAYQDIAADDAVTAGNYSKVQPTHDGAFVFSDSTTTPSLSSGTNSMVMDFANGVYVNTNTALYVNGNPVLTGETPEGDTLQSVTTRGNETTTSIISTGPYISGVTGLFSDKVGIGVTNPSYGLHLKTNPDIFFEGNIAQNDYLFDGGGENLTVFRDPDNTNRTYLTFDKDDQLYVGRQGSVDLIVNGSNSLNTLIQTDASENDVFFPDGKYGFGFEGVEPSALVHVSGDSFFDGNVGIGTALASKELDVVGDIEVYNSHSAVNVGSSNNVATGNNSVAFGINNLADGSSSIAIGKDNDSHGNRSIAIGVGNDANLNDGVVVGQLNTVNADAVVVGRSNDVGLGADISIGQSNWVSGTQAVGVGVNNTVSGNYAQIFGRSNQGQFASVIYGGQNTSQSSNGVLFGQNNDSSGDSQAFGKYNYVTGTESTAIGRDNVIDTHNALAAGWENKVYGSKSAAVGYGNVVSGSDSSAFGHYAVVGTNDTIEIGQYNSSREREGAVRIHDNHLVAISMRSGTAPTASTANDGFESETSLASDMYTIQRNGSDYILYHNLGGSIETTTLGAAEADTLQSVTTRGNETTTSIISTGPYISGVTGLFSDRLEVGGTGIIGDAQIGDVGHANNVAFAHKDNADFWSYALAQDTNGDTYVNYANGRALYFRKNNSTIGGFNYLSDFFVDTDTLYVDSSTDRVGIGTTNPAKELDVVGTVRAVDTSGNDQHQLRPTQLISYATDAIINAQSTGDDVRLNTQSNTVLIATAEGNVGIGTTSPQSPLHVEDAGGSGVRVSRTGNSAYLQLFPAYSSVPTIMGQGIGGLHLGYQSNTAGIRIDTSNNVGIGTTSPSSKLEVVEATANTAAAITVDSASWDAMLSLKNANGTWTILNDYTGAGTTGALAFWNGSYRMVIDNTGKVGIGTTNPSNKLTVEDTIGIKRSGVAAITTLQQNGSGLTLNAPAGYHPFIIKSNGVEKVRFANTGNVGIGTTNPDEKLEVAGKTHLGGRGQDGGAYIGYASLSETQGGAATILGNAVYAGNANNVYRKTSGDVGNFIKMVYSKGITFHTNVTGNAGSTEYSVENNEQMRIDLNGNVGIGATAPSVGLQLGNSTSGQTKTAIFNSEGGVEAGLTIKSRTNRAKLAVSDNDTTAYVVAEGTIASFGRADTAASTNISVLANGDVGIGTTSPSRLLTLENNSSTVTNNSQLRINNAGAGDAYIYLFAGSDWSLGIDNSDSDKFKLCTTNDVSDGTEVVTVDRNGNVGIGTTSPQAKLQVSGGIQMADDTDTASAAKVGTMRYRTATNEPVAVTGIELVTNGNFATASSWTKSSNVTISGGQATFTANSAAQYIIQGSLWAANSLSGQKVQLTYTIVSNSLNAGDFRIGGYTGASAFTLQGLPATVGTHSVTLDVRTSGGDDNAIDIYITSPATSGALVIDNLSLIHVTEEDASYADMCMQTAASTYEWVNIVRNSY
jgi:hypothetical protein